MNYGKTIDNCISRSHGPVYCIPDLSSDLVYYVTCRKSIIDFSISEDRERFSIIRGVVFCVDRTEGLCLWHGDTKVMLTQTI